MVPGVLYEGGDVVELVLVDERPLGDVFLLPVPDDDLRPDSLIQRRHEPREGICTVEVVNEGILSPSYKVIPVKVGVSLVPLVDGLLLKVLGYKVFPLINSVFLRTKP